MKKFRILLLMVVFMMSFVGSALSEQVTADKSPWSGTFIRGTTQFSKSTLEITPITNDSFNFKIQAYSGASTGGISGIAYIKDGVAYFDDGQKGTLKFVINIDTIELEQSYEMSRYGGMGVGFAGIYTNEKDAKTPIENENYFTDCKVFKGQQEQEFRRIVGENYTKFKNTAQYVSEYTNRDSFESRAYQMNVRGMFGIMESIIMIRDSDNAIWAAVIDNDRVLYFTNTNDAKYVPITISRWHDRFKKKPIYLIK